MSSSGISFSGLASGLDSAAIIESLVALERRPIALLNTKKKTYDKQAKLFGALDSKLKKLKDLASKLRVSGSLIDYKAEADQEKKVSLEVGSGAVAGSYKFKIDKLAKNEVRSSNAASDKTATVGEGTLVFEFEGSTPNKTVTISSSTGTSLEDIAKAINDQQGEFLHAAVVDIGAGGGYKLAVTSKVDGADGAFTVTEATGPGALNDLAGELASNETVTGSNAELEYNGLAIQRSSNKVTDLVPGIIVDLVGTTTSDLTITVSSDTEATSEKVKEFVDAYNEIVDFVQGQQKVTVKDSSGKDGGTSTNAQPLLGDQALLSVGRNLRDIMGSSVATSNQSYAMLAQIGISSDRDGKLTFNQSEFEEAVSKDPVAVRELFTAEDDGIADLIWQKTDAFTDTVDGILKTRQDGINRNKRDIDRQVERLEDRIEKYEDSLRRRYAALEQTIGRLESQRGSIRALNQKKK